MQWRGEERKLGKNAFIRVTWTERESNETYAVETIRDALCTGKEEEKKKKREKEENLR